MVLRDKATQSVYEGALWSKLESFRGAGKGETLRVPCGLGAVAARKRAKGICNWDLSSRVLFYLTRLSIQWYPLAA